MQKTKEQLRVEFKEAHKRIDEAFEKAAAPILKARREEMAKWMEEQETIHQRCQDGMAPLWEARKQASDEVISAYKKELAELEVSS